MPHPVKVHVGKRIRQRRWLVGMTQQQLAERIGTNFQVISNYERGTNHVSASRLWEIAAAQSMPVSYYFLGMNEEERDASLMQDYPQEFFEDKKTMEFVHFYYAIPETQRRRFFELSCALGASVLGS